MADALPPRVRRGYALGSVATGTFGTVPGLLLLPYLTDSLGIAAVVAGFIVFVPKAWDVVLNPVAGRISDRSTSPAGRRRPFLLAGGLGLAGCFALLFAGPTGPPALAAAWVVVWFLACATAYAFFQVPYVAMPAEMTLDQDERTSLMTWRVVVLALAILLSGATAPMVVNAFGGEETPKGYRFMGVYIALVLVVGVVGAWRGTRDAPEHRVETAGGSLRDQLRLVAATPPFRTLLTTFVVQALAVGTMLAGVAYMADDVLDDKGASTILFAAFVGPALVVTPLWERYARQRGKRSGYVAASLLMAVGMLGVWIAPTGLPIVLYVAAGLTGVGYAGGQVFPMSMLPDVAAADAERSGENRVGVFTGVWTAGETLGLALGPALFAGVLAVGGYESSTSGSATTQSAFADQAIQVGFGLLPCLLVLASLRFLLRYDLDERSVRVD
jgi:GPH family glycoside/pentoside/hexuronide:cation symporter